uniref:CCHC-type domain-containing protein n=1 Tax=Tanacetum cinerariifolium TaxID=118510 RepID=A0A699HLV0_TANCI|nr:hypothetical protein [Tanacetum cinerariifolium]
MSREVIIVGSTMRISLLYLGEYSQWRERFMNYLKEQKDGEAMINSIQNGDHPLPVLSQVSLARTTPNAIPTLKDPKKMRSSEYGKQDRKAAILYEYETFKATEGEQLLDTYLRYLQQNQGDLNDALGYKKKAAVVTSDLLAFVAEKTKVSKQKWKVKVQTDSEGSDDKDISDLKKITSLLAKAFNRKKFYAKPTNNNLRTSSANKKPEYVKSVEKKEDKKVDEKKRDMSKVKCYNCKKEGHFAKDCKKAKDQAWMESSSNSDQEINANMVFMAKMKKVLSDSDESSSSAEETIAEVLKIQVILKQSKDLRPSLYDEKVIGLGYTLIFLTHSDEALEIEKFKRARENKIEFAYNYGNLNAKKIIIDLEDEVVSLLEKEKANLETIESLKSKGFESSENVISELKNQSENDFHVVEKGCDQVENLKVISPGMFKLNVSQSVSPISVSETSCASKNVENKTKRKRRKRKSSKQNDKQVNNNVLRANRDFVHFSDLDTFSSVRRPKHSGVIWKKKGPSNTSNVDLSFIIHS